MAEVMQQAGTNQMVLDCLQIERQHKQQAVTQLQTSMPMVRIIATVIMLNKLHSAISLLFFSPLGSLNTQDPLSQFMLRQLLPAALFSSSSFPPFSYC